MNQKLVKIRRTFITVSDKAGIGQVAAALIRSDVELISTGGTRDHLKEGGLSVRDVSEVTGFPEMMDGRVKTLHPCVHGGLLAIRGNEKHEAAMKHHGIEPIDLLIVNLYPFEQTVAKRDVSVEDAIENIDIGGPAMIRSAAKNFENVTVIVHPSQYTSLLYELENNNSSTTIGFRQKRMVEAFELIARYDKAIATYVAAQYNQGTLSPRT